MTDEHNLVHGTNYRVVLNGDSWRRRVAEDARWSPHVIARWNILNGTFYIPQPRAEPITVRYSLRDDPNWGYTISGPVEEANRTNVGDAIDPEHYQFPGGAQVIDISEHLTANAAQALQYIARSSRIDGKNKGNTIEDLTKAIWFLDRELLRRKEAQQDG